MAFVSRPYSHPCQTASTALYPVLCCRLACPTFARHMPSASSTSIRTTRKAPCSSTSCSRGSPCRAVPLRARTLNLGMVDTDTQPLDVETDFTYVLQSERRPPAWTAEHVPTATAKQSPAEPEQWRGRQDDQARDGHVQRTPGRTPGLWRPACTVCASRRRLRPSPVRYVGVRANHGKRA